MSLSPGAFQAAGGLPSDAVPAELVPRTREVEVDVLVAHDLATASPAGMLPWRKAFGESLPSEIDESLPSEVEVKRNVKDARPDGRETDVVATAGSWRLLVEDKAVGGHFEDGQAESYKKAVDLDRAGCTRSCLVALQAFIQAFWGEAKLFSAQVSLEELAKELEAVSGGTAREVPELLLGYKYRAWRYQACADPKQDDHPPYPPVVKFGDAYRELARQLSQGRVIAGDFQGRGTRRISFTPWRKGIALWHNFVPGTVDLYVLLTGPKRAGSLACAAVAR